MVSLSPCGLESDFLGRRPRATLRLHWAILLILLAPLREAITPLGRRQAGMLQVRRCRRSSQALLASQREALESRNGLFGRFFKPLLHLGARHRNRTFKCLVKPLILRRSG